ncbi:MAG: HD domain-containing protein [Bacillota bacterium]
MTVPDDRTAVGATLRLAARLALIRLLGGRVLPRPVRRVMHNLVRHGFDAYAVGGAVRDLLLGRPPEDWDVATSARPVYVMSIFPRTVPTGLRHGTVRVIERSGAEVDVTTFRIEGPYSDRRRPDHVEFTDSLETDLARRDFTVNALALDLRGNLVDPFGGVRDLARGVIRCVGLPAKRFTEDALRMMRAVRLSAELGFRLDPETARAIRRYADLLARISVERVRDELERCLVSPLPDRALEDLRSLGLLSHVIPELEEGVGLEQNEHHAHTVWEHTLLTVASTPPAPHLRLAAMLHDVAKPRTLTVEDGRRHFFGHERVGAEMAGEILSRLRYDKATVSRVVHLVRHHMALRGQPDMKDAAVRRLINRVGAENIPDLIKLRRADRRASGSAGGPADLATAALLVRIERLLKEEKAFSLSDLAVTGRDVMRVARIGPGPQVGLILRRLLEEVLEDPSLNERSRLEERIREMVRPSLTRMPGRKPDTR